MCNDVELVLKPTRVARLMSEGVVGKDYTSPGEMPPQTLRLPLTSLKRLSVKIITAGRGSLG